MKTDYRKLIIKVTQLPRGCQAACTQKEPFWQIMDFETVYSKYSAIRGFYIVGTATIKST
jgi:hypothetical protein